MQLADGEIERLALLTREKFFEFFLMRGENARDGCDQIPALGKRRRTPRCKSAARGGHGFIKLLMRTIGCGRKGFAGGRINHRNRRPRPRDSTTAGNQLA